jgi:hypothetical protein
MCLVVIDLAVPCSFMLQETAEAGIHFCTEDSIHSACCPSVSISVVLDSHRYHAVRTTFCFEKLI